MDVFETVKKVIVDELSVDAKKVTLDAKLKEDLGADSIDAVQIIMDLEDAFGIEIDEDNAGSMETVGDVVKYIESNK